MANETIIMQLKAVISGVLTFQNKELISRPEWGSIKFDAAAQDFERTFSILNQLNILPVEFLSDPTVENIRTKLQNVGQVLRRIDEFSLEQGNPPQLRSGLVAELHSTVDDLFLESASWIPFLALQKGDVSKNMEALTKSIADAKALVDDT